MSPAAAVATQHCNERSRLKRPPLSPYPAVGARPRRGAGYISAISRRHLGYISVLNLGGISARRRRGEAHRAKLEETALLKKLSSKPPGATDSNPADSWEALTPAAAGLRLG